MEEANHVTLISSIAYGFYKILPFSLIFLTWISIHVWSQRIGATIELLRNYYHMHDWLAEYLSSVEDHDSSLNLHNLYTYIADPVNVEHVLKINFSNYPKWGLYRSWMHVLLGEGIFNADGSVTIVFREEGIKLSSIFIPGIN